MELNSREIMEILPHRYPFLLVDKITELEKGVRAVGRKNVSANEMHFLGHFPGNPIMPGVLILEALAQQDLGNRLYRGTYWNFAARL